MTQDESDYYLKTKLRLFPQDRYQHYKKAWYFHESSGMYVIITAMMDKDAITVNVFQSADIIPNMEE
jgi:hypothetical protein